MPNQLDIVKLASFSDELIKIAFKGRIGEAVSRGVTRGSQLLSGGKKSDVVKTVKGRETNILDKDTDVVFEGAGPRMGSMKNLKSKNKGERNEALKVLGARAVAGTAGVAAVGSGVKKHRKTERRQLGRAYVSGARDMYSRTRSRPQQ